MNLHFFGLLAGLKPKHPSTACVGCHTKRTTHQCSDGKFRCAACADGPLPKKPKAPPAPPPKGRPIPMSLRSMHVCPGCSRFMILHDGSDGPRCLDCRPPEPPQNASGLSPVLGALKAAPPKPIPTLPYRPKVCATCGVVMTPNRMNGAPMCNECFNATSPYRHRFARRPKTLCDVCLRPTPSSNLQVFAMKWQCPSCLDGIPGLKFGADAVVPQPRSASSEPHWQAIRPTDADAGKHFWVRDYQNLNNVWVVTWQKGQHGYSVRSSLGQLVREFWSEPIKEPED